MFIYGSDFLTTKILHRLAKGVLKGTLSDEIKLKIINCREVVDSMVAKDQAVYGINTGFGPLCDTKIKREDTERLQHNLLLSHAVGVGNPIQPLLSKMMLIAKLHSLCKGYSGVRLEVAERILMFIDLDILPVVFEQGSVGASGDLAPLSHLFLPLVGEGEIWEEGKRVPAKKVLSKFSLSPLSLRAKEGLALINGTQFIVAFASLGIQKMSYLQKLADLSGAMSLEGAQGSITPYREELHTIRPFKGNMKVAKRIRKIMKDSENLASHKDCGRVQDPYSLRCMAQVHGASRNAWSHVKKLAEVELNSVTDNPIIINSKEAISGGNFHGQPLAMALDYLCIAASELGNIADRRCYLLLEGKNGLPRFLVDDAGLNSGLMILQYTTAALVSENKSLCYPVSADSIPTSLGQEDHVSMGSISGRKLNTILENLEKILAIELLYSAQALDFRRPLKFSKIVELNYEVVRKEVTFLEQDRYLKKDIDAIISLVKQKAFTVK